MVVAKEEGIVEWEQETASKMLKKGVDLGDISEFTGLSLQEIENLK
ncbi:MAG: hypothetical protein LBJ96_03885 [Holosporaceae bacterium]|jgi:hypothetical protein|nr:hypothetical protein [Holosporaceae bacterium]